MKTAITIWNNRIAPVYDSARTFLIVELDKEGAESEQTCTVDEKGKLNFLISEKVDRVICGAISRQCEMMLQEKGIELISFVGGPVCRVVEAVVAGEPSSSYSALPGCRGPHCQGGRGMRRRRGWGRGE